MNIEITKNTDQTYSPYTAHIDTSDRTIHTPSQFNAPVHVQTTGTTQTFYANICGFRAQEKNVDALVPQIELLIDGLINMARLPRHVFIARRAKKVYPVYTVGNEVIVTTPAGPVFQHVELAKVRERLTDYLHDSHVLGKKGNSDKLHVRDTNMHTLELRRPVMYLKKRVDGEVDFWAPVFENGSGDGIYVYAANARRDVPLRSSGTEALILTQIVAEALRTDNRLNDVFDLRPDRLSHDYWMRLKEQSQPQGSITLGGQEVTIYTKEKTWFGVEERTDEARYGLYIEASREGVIKQIATDFQRRGLS